MNLVSTMLLGFIAGVTILLGLPIGRLRTSTPTLSALLNATVVGVLLFLFWDVLSAAGLAVGLLSLVYYQSWMARQLIRIQKPVAGPGDGGPGAMGVTEVKARRQSRLVTWSAARRLSLLIAVGIGLHNFAEGLAIGQSAASG